MEFSQSLGFILALSSVALLGTTAVLITAVLSTYTQGTLVPVASTRFLARLDERGDDELLLLTDSQRIFVAKFRKTHEELSSQVPIPSDDSAPLVARLISLKPDSSTRLKWPRIKHNYHRNETSTRVEKNILARRVALQEAALSRIQTVLEDDSLPPLALIKKFRRHLIRERLHLWFRALVELGRPVLSTFGRFVVGEVATWGCIGIFIALIIHALRIVFFDRAAAWQSPGPLWESLGWFITLGSTFGFILGMVTPLKAALISPPGSMSKRRRIELWSVIIVLGTFFAVFVSPLPRQLAYFIAELMTPLLNAIQFTPPIPDAVVGARIISIILIALDLLIFIPLRKHLRDARWLKSHLPFLFFLLPLTIFFTWRGLTSNQGPAPSLVTTAMFATGAVSLLTAGIAECVYLVARAAERHRLLESYRHLGIAATYIWHPLLVALCGTIFSLFYVNIVYWLLPDKNPNSSEYKNQISEAGLGFLLIFLITTFLVVFVGRKRHKQDQNLAAQARTIRGQ